MTLAGMPGSQVSNDGDIMRMIADLDRRVKELAAQDLLTPVGITAQPNGITVTGTETVNGSLNVNGPMNVAGAMAVTGTLSLPAGIIGNAALTSPVYPQTAHADLHPFSLATGANAEKLRTTVNVPAGYTQALVFATATISSRNTTTSQDQLYIDCRINGAVAGWSSQASTPANAVAFAANSGTALLTGLGSTFYISANASSGAAAWPSNNDATMNIDAIILFLR